MRTISLRTLLREPRKVKRMTGTGNAVRVTDNGEPLWILRSANGVGSEEKRLRATDEVLEEVLRGRHSRISSVRLLEDSRR